MQEYIDLEDYLETQTQTHLMLDIEQQEVGEGLWRTGNLLE